MKRLLLLFFCFVFAGVLRSQIYPVQISAQLVPPYSGYLPDYADREFCPFLEFENHSCNVFYKNVIKSEITNAVFITTKCLYKDFEFDLVNLNNGKTAIITESKDVCEKLQLEVRERGVFQKEIELNQLKRVWEIRAQSTIGLPLPDGIELIKEITIS